MGRGWIEVILKLPTSHKFEMYVCIIPLSQAISDHNPLSANPTKWSNTLKQVSNLPTNCLCLFDQFVILALKGLRTLVMNLNWMEVIFNLATSPCLMLLLFPSNFRF